MTDRQENLTAPQRPLIGLLPIGLCLVLFGLFINQIGAIASGQSLQFAWSWVPSLGVSLSFLLDGLSLTFVLLITGIGALVFAYSKTYMADHPQFGRFVLFLTSFMLAMLGLVLADNLITLFVFWELTTITSYLLIGFGHETEKGRRSALQALFVTGSGALALLAGFILLGIMAGSFDLADIHAKGAEVRAHGLYLPALILILLGAFTKSAQFPFHFWLPNAMAAPTPVSAFLHSATMVKAGIYLLARLHPTLSGTEIWFWTLTVVGAFTALFASILSLRQTDLKQTLAYTTLMALGVLTLFLGQGSSYAITAFATFLIVHCLYKAALFLVVGCIDRATGTRDIGVLAGLSRSMPVTAFAAALAALSMAGLPPLLGFIAKELQYASLAALGSVSLIFTLTLVLANALMVAVAGMIALRPFWGKSAQETPHRPAEAPWLMLLGPLILALLGTFFGLAPHLLQNWLVTPIVASLLGDGAQAKALKLWAGVNLPLLLSIVTIALGLMIYASRRNLKAWLIRIGDQAPSLDAAWDSFLLGLKNVAAWQTQLIQPGILRTYIAMIFATTFVALTGAMVARGAWPTLPSFSDITWPIAAVSVLICTGAIMTTLTSSRVVAMAALGVVGIGVALVFIAFSAPDVAITQLLVETLIVVLVAVALLRLPLLDRKRRDVRPRDALLALGIGGIVTAVLLAVLERPLDKRLTDYFEMTSWPEAHGRNIVNVILVDFRALDTFGEIAVVVIAALSAYALLRTTPKQPQTAEGGRQGKQPQTAEGGRQDKQPQAAQGDKLKARKTP